MLSFCCCYTNMTSPLQLLRSSFVSWMHQIWFWMLISRKTKASVHIRASWGWALYANTIAHVHLLTYLTETLKTLCSRTRSFTFLRPVPTSSVAIHSNALQQEVGAQKEEAGEATVITIKHFLCADAARASWKATVVLSQAHRNHITR